MKRSRPRRAVVDEAPVKPDIHPADRHALPGFDDIVPIGFGGASTVYRARQIAFDRLVAVKILTDADASVLRRFEREKKVLGRLSGYPSIAQVFDAAITPGGVPYLVMQYHPGGSLADQIRRGGPQPLDRVLAIGVKLAATLDAAHAHGVLHRDIKPGNIMLDLLREPVLVDFGISGLTGEGHEHTAALTYQYAAPEVLNRPTAASRESDQYSLALTLWALLVGDKPWADLAQRRLAPIPDGTPVAASDVLRRALAGDPTQRFPSCKELARALQDVQGSCGHPVTQAPGLGEDEPATPHPAATTYPEESSPGDGEQASPVERLHNDVVGESMPDEATQPGQPPTQKPAAASHTPRPASTGSLPGEETQPGQPPTRRPAPSPAPAEAPLGNGFEQRPAAVCVLAEPALATEVSAPATLDARHDQSDARSQEQIDQSQEHADVLREQNDGGDSLPGTETRPDHAYPAAKPHRRPRWASRRGSREALRPGTPPTMKPAAARAPAETALTGNDSEQPPAAVNVPVAPAPPRIVEAASARESSAQAAPDEVATVGARPDQSDARSPDQPQEHVDNHPSGDSGETADPVLREHNDGDDILPGTATLPDHAHTPGKHQRRPRRAARRVSGAATEPGLPSTQEPASARRAPRDSTGNGGPEHRPRAVSVPVEPVPHRIVGTASPAEASAQAPDQPITVGARPESDACSPEQIDQPQEHIDNRPSSDGGETADPVLREQNDGGDIHLGPGTPPDHAYAAGMHQRRSRRAARRAVLSAAAVTTIAFMSGGAMAVVNPFAAASEAGQEDQAAQEANRTDSDAAGSVPLAAPTGVSAAAEGDRSVIVRWDDNNAGRLPYFVYRIGSGEAAVTTAMGAQSATLDAPPGDDELCFRVGVMDQNQALTSDIACVTTSAA